MKKIFFFLAVLLVSVATVEAQDSKDFMKSFEEFRRGIHQDYNDFRSKCMKDYIAFLRNAWADVKGEVPERVPQEQTVPPVVMPIEEIDKPLDDKKIEIEEVVTPVIETEPRPEPVEPVKEVPVVTPKYVSFSFFGTEARVRFDVSKSIKLSGVSGEQVAVAFEKIDTKAYDNLLFDCLALRSELQLSDWAYLIMLNRLSETICGGKNNNAVLTMAYLYMMSGYKMRLALKDDRIYLLYATRHHIYDQTFFEIDGVRYYGIEELPLNLFVCDAAFPKEKELSLIIDQNQKLSYVASVQRTVKAEAYSDIHISFAINKNLMDFYTTYPTSFINDNIMTRWAFYANTPLDARLSKQIYPALRTQLQGLSEPEAVGRLLNLVQTGLEYGYDDEVWGDDRAFFAEESLFYPYCDCEDRSILFTRLVRDLLGLKCILVYYPGHLASAVCFNQHVAGDYIELGGKRFVIADATYVNAPVGSTMPKMDNSTAKVIMLEN